MYDVVVVGQGMSGLLSAIWAKEQGRKVGLVSQGTGKIIQSSGLFDYYGKTPQTDVTEKAIEKFKKLVNKLELPYQGNLHQPASVVTGAGYLKETILYPETIVPIPDLGHVIIVGFKEIADFQPAFVKGNLERERPNLKIDTLSVTLGKKSLRTMTQLDAARLLDKKEIRTGVIAEINKVIQEKNLGQPRLFIFPASLGIQNWKTVLEEFSEGLGALVTEAPGMPPNASAIRLHEALRKEAIRLGIRFYSDTKVIGSIVEDNRVKNLTIKTINKATELIGKNYIIAAGGVLGGGHEVTSQGLVDTVLGLELNSLGQYSVCPENVIPVGASLGANILHYGITGGIFSVQSSYGSILKLEKLLGGIVYA